MVLEAGQNGARDTAVQKLVTSIIVATPATLSQPKQHLDNVSHNPKAVKVAAPPLRPKILLYKQAAIKAASEPSPACVLR